MIYNISMDDHSGKFNRIINDVFGWARRFENKKPSMEKSSRSDPSLARP